MPKCRKYRCCHVISDSYGSHLSQISLWPRYFGQLQTVVMLSSSKHDFCQGHSEICHSYGIAATTGSTLTALLKLVCKDVLELAAVDEAALDVAGGVGEAHGVAAQGLDSAVDGFGGPVA